MHIHFGVATNNTAVILFNESNEIKEKMHISMRKHNINLHF